MDNIVVSKDDVTKLLKGLNSSKVLGPDEFHPRVLKELTIELDPVFAHLFQQSIDTGEIPREWSLANMCPLLKKSDRSLACNYRSVSLTCVPSQQKQNVSVTFLESCSLVASDLTLQKRFYNVLSDLCLEMSNIQKHVW